MNDQQHTQNLNAITQDIQQLAQEAYQAILAKIGTAPASVIIRQVLKEYSLEVQSAVDSMMRDYLSLGTPSNTPLASVKGLVLSEHLYNNAMLAVAPVVTRIINEHANDMKTARELAKAIYEGYDFKEDPLDVQKELPKYLHKPLAKLIASGLKTPALRAAYLQYLNNAGDKASKADMAKLLQVAFYERNRYLANRIAQTELHRIHSDTRASEIMADDQVHWVQVRMSQTHPKYDICDYHSKLNAYGKGAGIYPKGKAPKPPYHPFCRCKLSPVITIDPPKTPPVENKSASRAFISSLPTSQAVAILGSREKLAQFMKDKDLSVLGIVDQNKPKGYETRYVGEVEAKESKTISTLRGVYEETKKQQGKPLSDRDFSWLKNYPHKISIYDLPDNILSYLKNKRVSLTDGVVYLSSNTILHSIRDGKAGELTLDELLSVPSILSDNNVFYDKKEKNVLFVRFHNDKVIKIAVAVPYKKTGLNEIRTMMYVDKNKFEGAVAGGHYEKI
jgi:hypothetical protein